MMWVIKWNYQDILYQKRSPILSRGRWYYVTFDWDQSNHVESSNGNFQGLDTAKKKNVAWTRM